MILHALGLRVLLEATYKTPNLQGEVGKDGISVLSVHCYNAAASWNSPQCNWGGSWVTQNYRRPSGTPQHARAAVYRRGRGFWKALLAAFAQQLSSSSCQALCTMTCRTLAAQDEISPLQKIRGWRLPERGFVTKMLNICKLALVGLDTTAYSSKARCQTSDRALSVCTWTQGPHLTAENHDCLEKSWKA